LSASVKLFFGRSVTAADVPLQNGRHAVVPESRCNKSDQDLIQMLTIKEDTIDLARGFLR
jgi:hypothetical protein